MIRNKFDAEEYGKTEKLRWI